MLQKLEGYMYSLWHWMGCYTIHLTPGAQNLTTVVTKFGKFRSKVDQLVLCHIEGVKAYIDNILGLSKGSFNDIVLKQTKLNLLHSRSWPEDQG
jgi:hypothetical protein